MCEINFSYSFMENLWLKGVYCIGALLVSYRHNFLFFSSDANDSNHGTAFAFHTKIAVVDFLPYIAILSK